MEKIKVFPAPAGVILNLEFADIYNLRFPRTCGGDPIVPPYGNKTIKFSPHLRG